MRWLLAVVAFGLALLCWGVAKADWQVHMLVGDVWVPAVTARGNVAKVYEDRFKCEWSLVEISYGVVSGTRLQCQKVKPR